MELSPDIVWKFLTEHFSAGVAVAVAFTGVTAAGLALLRRDDKDSIALWLMGTSGSEESWSRTFCKIFDAVFGKRHFSLRCILPSILASLIAVMTLWLLIGTGAGYEARLEAVPQFGAVLLVGIVVNAGADYVSLLETRWLLGRMDRLHHWVFQALLLLADLIFTALIIWAALWVFQRTGLYRQTMGGDGEDLGQVLLIFSPFAVFFYSTFVTSVWVWFYITSTWMMRILARLPLHRIFDIAGRPVGVLSYVLFPMIVAMGFVGSVAIAFLTEKGAAGLTLADRAVCALTRDRSCLSAARSTDDPAAIAALIASVVGECRNMHALDCYDDFLTKRGWSLGQVTEFFEAGCSNNEMEYCAALGVFAEYLSEDHARARSLYMAACDNGVARGCSGLAGYFWMGHDNSPRDVKEAAKLFEKACILGDPEGCTGHGITLADSQPDLALAALSAGCDGGDPRGCFELGGMYERHADAVDDLQRAARAYDRACRLGDSFGCDWLARLIKRETVPGWSIDNVEEAFRLSCARDDPGACRKLEEMERLNR